MQTLERSTLKRSRLESTDGPLRFPNGTYAANLDLDRRSCLVVGAGTIGARKVEGLARAGADVTLVAPHISEPARQLIRRQRDRPNPITVHQRSYRRGEAAFHRLVVTATGIPDVDHQVFLDCEASGVWCNSADDVDNCSFILPAVVRRGPIMVSVSSGGRSPAVASWLRRRIDDVLSKDLEGLVAVAEEVRSLIRDEFGSTEVVDWASALDRHGGLLLELAARGNHQQAVDLLLDALVRP